MPPSTPAQIHQTMDIRHILSPPSSPFPSRITKVAARTARPSHFIKREDTATPSPLIKREDTATPSPFIKREDTTSPSLFSIPSHINTPNFSFIYCQGSSWGPDLKWTLRQDGNAPEEMTQKRFGELPRSHAIKPARKRAVKRNMQVDVSGVLKREGDSGEESESENERPAGWKADPSLDWLDDLWEPPMFDKAVRRTVEEIMEE